MSTHGKQIMQAVTLILEGEHNIEVKEQVCVPFSFLRNIFWVWVPRGIVVRNLLSLLCCKRLCWVQKCYRHGKGLKEKTLSHPWNSFQEFFLLEWKKIWPESIVLPSVSCTIHTVCLYGGWTPLTILEWILFPGFAFLALHITMLWTKFLQLPDEKPLMLETSFISLLSYIPLPYFYPIPLLSVVFQ